MSIAWKLAQSGWHVTVFDKGSIGGEASWAGAGMLAPGGEIEAPSPFATLAIESRKQYGDFVRELQQMTSVPIDYQECGALDLAYSQQDLDEIETRATRQAAIGISSKPVSPKDVPKFWPRVRADDLLGARFYRDDAIVNPRDVVAALVQACKRLPVTLVPQCAVSRVESSSYGAALHSTRSMEHFRAAVIAAGAWSSEIEVAGAPPLPPVEPIKGHLIGFDQPEHTCSTILRHRHTYLLQRANGLLIVGASVEHAGFNREIRHAVAADLANAASTVLPHLAETSPSQVWTGFRPLSDELRLGQWHSQALYLAYGHYRNGILLAPATAMRLTNEINSNLQTHQNASASPLQ